VVLALLAIGDDRRARLLEASDRVADRLLEQGLEGGVIAVAAGLGHGIDEGLRTRDATDGLGRDVHSFLRET
jgi:hypothetical protein